jgi:ribonuclease HI
MLTSVQQVANHYLLPQPVEGVIRIYTDGACAGNPGPGGWGGLLQYGNISKTINGYELDTTNNRMEIRAVIESLKMLKRSCNSVEIYTDSKYVQLGITMWIHNWLKNNWRTCQNKPVKNCDLWNELHCAVTQHRVSWHWVKGHANNAGNEIADQLANEGKQTAIRMLRCQ